MKGKFSTWLSRQISLGLENGMELHDIKVDYRLSVLKPLHGKCLVELYNHMSTAEGKEIVANGWKKAGIFDAIKLGSSGLPSLDPFADICPLIESLQLRENLSLSTLFPEELNCFREKSKKVRMTPTQNGSLTVILMIAQNQNQMMMETRLMHSMMACD